MRRIVIVSILSCIALVGCENKQAKLAKLQDEYSKAHKQYFDDCVAPQYGGTDTYFKGTKPEVATPQQVAAHQQQCDQEAKRAGNLQMQLQSAAR
jgi:hypothetical protein